MDDLNKVSSEFKNPDVVITELNGLANIFEK